MGNIMSALYDDIEDYRYMCEKIGVKPKESNEMYKHAKEIVKNLTSTQQKSLGYIYNKFK